ncbi:hypothetical protein [Halovenus sp. HT40]|uniref:hypothetical protein n=1 Tax=Halovenus sp. HT40 TaxID=3126691 RepID=UPI00300F45B1
MSQDTGLVKIYVPMSHKETWQQEADEKNYKSTSKYLHELIQEARAIREEGFLAPQDSDQEVQRLKKKIEELEDRLAEANQQSRDSVMIDDSAFLKQFLTEDYQTFDEVSQKVIESDTLDELLREPVEDELYFLAAREEVEFGHGHGWRLAGGGDR